MKSIALCIAFAAMSILLVTAVGYFDEGNQHLYPGFKAYLASGMPPFRDYVLWAVVAEVVGFLIYSVLSLIVASFTLRLTLASASIPLIIGGLHVGLFATQN
jgi:hypothetical protein